VRDSHGHFDPLIRRQLQSAFLGIASQTSRFAHSDVSSTESVPATRMRS
jgi:hypothetical protein